jgi:glycosyltransferase involved in cell wall biosynthesis
MQIATIVCRREVARARVLAASVAEHAAATPVIALVLDATAEDQGRVEPFELLLPSDAAIDDLGTLAGMLTAAELREACKPLLLAHLLGRAPGESALYIDPDSLVCGPLEDIELLAADHAVLVKTRTARSLPQDGRRPNEADLRGWGLHDPGLIALGAGHDHHALLDWWAARGRAGSGPQGGSLPVERIATLGRGAYEVGDDGFGASFWDLHGRTIVAQEHSTLIDGTPLRLMRFPGFDPRDPLALSDAQSRLRAAEQPALAALCERYARLLLDAGEIEASQLSYAFERLPDGTQLDHRLRTIYRQAVEQAGLRRSPFTRWGMEEFYVWLGEPAATGRALGINRLCMLVRDEQPQLREAYPDLDRDTDAYGLIEWLHQHGVREGTLPAAVVPPTSPNEREAERRRRARTTNFGVNVAGYFTAEIGIGEAVRLLVSALDAAAVPLLPLSPPTLPSSRKDHQYVSLPISTPGFPLNLICINADGLLRFGEEVGSGFFDGRYNIGLWWWEVDRLPNEWLAAFELLDEVWVGSEHVASALAPISPIPVYTVRIPILARNTAPLDRAALGLADEWVFLSMFDHGSVVERKNPLGTIAAFTAAFSPSSGAALILKSVNAEHDHFGRDRVRAAAAPHPHVHLLEGHLSPAQTHALIATADCFVSLHRAEGLGLVPAEAMMLGKPVIATGYSGNLDYMTPANSYLVDYSLRKVGSGCWPYPEDAVWAEADLEHAAQLMREVFEDQSAARERGALAAAQLAETHSLFAAGHSMRSRIESVMARWEGEPFLPLPEFEVDLSRGRRGRLLRRLAPGVLAMLEHELELLWAANEQRKFDLDAAARGTLLSTQAATLAALRRIESAAPEPLRESELEPLRGRLD